MSFVVFNTRSRRKETFATLEEGVVRMYNCGPTVYGRQHIGNFRSFLFADTLRRWLEYLGYEVRQVMNITDVGHLLEDADRGEDKIERRAREEQRHPRDISAEHAAKFFEDIRALGLRSAQVYPRASEHIPEMLEIIEGLLAKGYAYQVDGNVYYDVAKFERYGELSGNRLEDLEAGARIEVREDKRDPRDFALWKEDPEHVMKWVTRFGEHGFPGWHIECSAMARKHLGDELDLHTGGEDNIFPHHECEIAQTEAFTGKPFARYWMHAKFLQVDGGKMAKSLGNVYTLDDVRARGHSLRALRFCLIRGHYRQPLNFTWKILEESAAALAKLDDLALRLRRAARGERESTPAERTAIADLRSKFEDALNDDLAVPQALAALFEYRAVVERDGVGCETAVDALAFLEQVHGVLGVLELSEQVLDADVDALIEARKAARAARDWAEADRIRDELVRKGIALEDTPTGVVWRRTR